jgi:pimeloyl-ACP methyl ester carboxylesterase
VTVALVALHGFALGPALWDPLRARHSEWRWHTPWLPGHGPAGEAPAGTFEEVVARGFAELPAGLWVGYSMGARVLLQAALLWPERPRALVLIGGNARGAVGDAARRAFDEGWARRIEEDGVEAFAGAWERLPVLATREPAAGLEALRREHRAPALAAAMRCLGRAAQPDLSAGLRALPCPVHWIVGADDAGAFGEARDLARPGCLHVAPGGHNTLADAPAVVEAVLSEVAAGFSKCAR